MVIMCLTRDAGPRIFRIFAWQIHATRSLYALESPLLFFLYLV